MRIIHCDRCKNTILPEDVTITTITVDNQQFMGNPHEQEFDFCGDCIEFIAKDLTNLFVPVKSTRSTNET